MKKRAFLFLSCFLVSCGSFSDVSVPLLSLQVNKLFSAPHSFGTVSRYELTLSAEGVEDRHFSFEGESERIFLENISYGNNRTLFLQAFNEKNQVIYEAFRKNINIEEGKRNVLEIFLESIPVFTNLSSSRAVYNTQLQFQIFSKPGEDVVIEQIEDDETKLLFDISSSNLALQFSESTGLANLSPALLPAGKYHFQVRNVNNGKKSELYLTVLDGAQNEGAAFVAAGFSAQSLQQRGKVTW